MPTEACVYVLAERDGSALKIGWAVSASHRASVVARNHDPARSYQLTGFDRKGAGAAERALHLMFRAYRVGRPAGAGRTEWFDGSVYDALRAFTEANKALLGYERLAPVPPPSTPTEARAVATSPLPQPPGWLTFGGVLKASDLQIGVKVKGLSKALSRYLEAYCAIHGQPAQRHRTSASGLARFFEPARAAAWLEAEGREMIVARLQKRHGDGWGRGNICHHETTAPRSRALTNVHISAVRCSPTSSPPARTSRRWSWPRSRG